MPKTMTGKPQLNRRVNRALILDRIRLRGEISRADLAKMTEIKPPTVTAVVRDLIEEGLVVETGNGEARGGRAPRMIALSSDHPQTIGFELTDTAILAGLCDLRGQLLLSKRVAFTPQSPELTVDRLLQVGDALIGEWCEKHGWNIDWSDLKGVGVALPGLIDTANGVVRWSRPFGWRGVDLRSICQQRWGVATDIVNDSVAGSSAAHFLDTNIVQNLVYLVLRFDDAAHDVVGIGTGLIIQGEPYHGEFGAAGEITTPVRHPLVDARDDAGRPYPDIRAFVDALHRDQGSARAAMDRVAHDLSLLLVHAINLLEPGRLILEVDVPELGQGLWARLQQIMQEYALSDEPGRTQIELSSLGDFGGVRGAIVPALLRVFKLPRWS